MSNNLEKYDIILTHDIIAKDTGHKLIIQTAAGQYIGEPYPDSADYPEVSAIAQAIKNLRVSEYDEKNPTAIFLVDVEVRTNSIGGPFKMPYICLFLDQILGVSIGKFEKPTEE
ncbi:hypothetical protein [Streptococcus cristatus]|jgi:hypothetical protein|uniref:hypothetical protein n=1 Tax=Streptococcus cristatus TaxID=45634 RepID=UPI00065F7494|nr:hypothetical protein [Streptococcus cristatus]